LISPNTIFWDVDAQVDFMHPEGKLYVPAAESIVPNIKRLVQAASQNRVLLISSADAHNADDPELREWPPHCLKGTPGADLIAEAYAPRRLTVPNQKGYVFPENLSSYQQVILQKNALDVFTNPNTDVLLEKLKSKPFSFDSRTEHAVFGVVTEYCVVRAAEGLLKRGYRVAIVEDAIRSIDAGKGCSVLNSLKHRGARVISTDDALGLISRTGQAGA
jgi:nicotinamidase/pyrazinamidase